MQKPTLSLVVIVLNEERHISKVLSAAAPLVDEIIFVDSGSTDQTIPIAQSFNATVIHQDWLGYGKQKNFAIGQASCDWILSLDGDEIMTPELTMEIKSIFAGAELDEVDGFTIPRILYVGNAPVMHGGFYPDRHLRLFRRGKGKFNDRLVHESVSVDGKVRQLKHPLKNMAYDDVDQFAASMDTYAKLSALQKMRNGFNWWSVSPINELVHPWWTFLYRYVGRLGFLDGLLGLKLQLYYSDYVRKKTTYLREARKQAADKRVR